MSDKRKQSRKAEKKDTNLEAAKAKPSEQTSIKQSKERAEMIRSLVRRDAFSRKISF